MQVKKFVGRSTGETLRQVRDALGPDALILSSREIAGKGVELLAVAEGEIAAVTVNSGPTSAGPSSPQTPKSALARRVAYAYNLEDNDPPQPAVYRPSRNVSSPSDAAAVLISHRRQGPITEGLPPPGSAPAVVRQNNRTPTRTPVDSEARYVSPEVLAQLHKTRTQPTPAAVARPSQQSAVLAEVAQLRELVESQLSGFAWGELSRQSPERVKLLQRLLASGFSPRVARELYSNLPERLSGPAVDSWIRRALLRNLQVCTPSDDPIEKGGVFALVGPTGVGKTTTVAKLASRYTLRHGSSNVALISTDSYRIGAHDQLRIYGKILNVPVYSVRDESDLQLTLGDLANKRLILIDTVGMSQRDQRLTEQIALLGSAGQTIRRLLLVAANTQAQTLDDVMRRYQHAGISGCVLTKIDEALSLGPALDTILRFKLKLSYVANGQRVPEDLHLPKADYLIDRALRPKGDAGTFEVKNEEYPVFLAAQPGASGLAKVVRPHRRHKGTPSA